MIIDIHTLSLNEQELNWVNALSQLPELGCGIRCSLVLGKVDNL